MKLAIFFFISELAKPDSKYRLEVQQSEVEKFLREKGWAGRGYLIKEELGIIEEKQKRYLSVYLNLVEYCLSTKSKLLITRGEILSKKSFLSPLLANRVDYRVLDGHMNSVYLEVQLQIAENIARLNSERSKISLQAAKRRGVKLGNPNIEEASKRGTIAIIDAADRFAWSLKPRVDDIQREGKVTLKEIADTFNRRGVSTQRKKTWTPASVRNLLLRINKINKQKLL